MINKNYVKITQEIETMMVLILMVFFKRGVL